MRYFALILVVFIVGCTTFKSQTHIQKDTKQTFVEFEEFGIRTKPILNREYIIFLCWYVDVYGEFYPNKVLEILPFNTSETPDLTLAEVGGMFVNSDTIFNPLLKDYILNPKFIDYPLIGLSKHQILEMQKWMNDRYNENVLIDAQYLLFYESAINEDCFVTESFLVGQWLTSVGNAWEGNRYEIGLDSLYAPVAWHKHDYKSNFRLPYYRESIETEKRIDFDNHLREYSFGKEDFLWKWNEYYFQKNKGFRGRPIEMLFKWTFGENSPYPFPVNSKYQPSKEPMTSLILSENEQQFNNIAYLKENSGIYPEKDSIGRMSFVIVGADKENRPLVADRIQASNEPINNAIYRIVYNKMIDSSHLPQ